MYRIVLSPEQQFLSFLYRKSEAVVTSTNSRDSKPVEEVNGCLQENESTLS
jgi:hypothetical protein